MLPNLVAGRSIEVFARLDVPPRARAEEVCRVHLGWDEPVGAGGRGPGADARQSLGASLTLPAAPEARWKSMKADAVVREHLALLLAARARRRPRGR